MRHARNSTQSLLVLTLVVVGALIAAFSFLDYSARCQLVVSSTSSPPPVLQPEPPPPMAPPAPEVPIAYPSAIESPQRSVLAKLPRVTVSFSMSVNSAKGLRESLTHLLRGCNYEFDDIFIVLDTSGWTPDEPAVEGLEGLKRDGLISRYVLTDYRSEAVELLYRSIYGENFRERYNLTDSQEPLRTKSPYAKGHLAYMVEMEECRTDYCVHFDTDLSTYTPSNFSWVQECITRLEHYNNQSLQLEYWKDEKMVTDREGEVIDPSRHLGFCLPAMGPRWNYTGDPKDWYHFFRDNRRNVIVTDYYTSRYSLFKRRTYEERLKPFVLEDTFWERIVTSTMRAKKVNRFDLLEGAWAIHTQAGHSGPDMLGVFPRGMEGEAETGHQQGGAYTFTAWPHCPPPMA